MMVLISALLKGVISEFEINLVKQGVCGGGDRQTETETETPSQSNFIFTAKSNYSADFWYSQTTS